MKAGDRIAVDDGVRVKFGVIYEVTEFAYYVCLPCCTPQPRWTWSAANTTYAPSCYSPNQHAFERGSRHGAGSNYWGPDRLLTEEEGLAVDAERRLREAKGQNACHAPDCTNDVTWPGNYCLDHTHAGWAYKHGRNT